MVKKIITFENSAKEYILDCFDKSVNAEGYVVEKTDSTQKVLASDGEDLEISQFAGIRKGSEVFIKTDLMSIIALSDYLK
jgi:hypothetical protein